MQTAEMGASHDASHGGRLDGTREGRVFVQGEMGPRPVVIGEVPGEGPPQVPSIQDDQVVETLPADRADQPFHGGILPGRARRRAPISDAEAGHAAAHDRVHEEPIAIM